ncbi:MAG: phosphoethanolamine transferase CptA [Candidatus Contendobacter sp.]|nr:phosphoethanolamine transferase CptA [Candidatus Contendobacter sp.]
MQRSDILAFLVSLSVIGLLIWGLVYFVNHWWARLPTAVALIVCILLAVMVIGYPIYALARWSDRYLARVREAPKDSGSSKADP